MHAQPSCNGGTCPLHAYQAGRTVHSMSKLDTVAAQLATPLTTAASAISAIKNDIVWRKHTNNGASTSAWAAQSTS